MKKITSLSGLLTEELSDLFDAEEQLIKILPKMKEASQSSSLKMILEDDLVVTQEHVVRIQDIFSNLGQQSHGIVCKTIKGIIVQSEDAINKIQKGPSLDTVIVNLVERMEHYQITGYEIARQHAEDLGHNKIVDLVNKTMDEERDINLRLKEVLQVAINTQATSGGSNAVDGRLSKKDVTRFIDEGNPNTQ